jgi:hypothetical protein
MAGLRQRDERRTKAAADLAALQPKLKAARAAWQPFADQIAAIEHQLQAELRPAMWSANHEVVHRGLGHRHGTRRRAREATARVNESQATIAEIRADGAVVKELLDVIESRGNHLAEVVNATFGGNLGQLDQLELNGVDRVVASLDTWTAWAKGRPVASTHLAVAVETLTENAWHSPVFVANPRDVGRDQWMEVLSPITQLLVDHGIDIDNKRGLEVEPAGLELGIDL